MGTAMPHQPASDALARLRVIDLMRVRAGPTACRQRADWGADVAQAKMPEHMRGDDILGGQEGSDVQYTRRTPSTIARSAPRRGEHTEEVLAEIGLAPADPKRLKSTGVY